MANRSLLVRALWFVSVGWWLTPVLVNAAWLLNATIILLPFGIKLINLVPTALTLAEPRSLDDTGSASQPSLVVRATYFVLIGWWLSWLWANVAAALSLTIIGIPAALVGILVYGAVIMLGSVIGALMVGRLVIDRFGLKSMYVALVTGILVMVALGELPWIGGFISLAVLFTGIGGLVTATHERWRGRGSGSMEAASNDTTDGEADSAPEAGE